MATKLTERIETLEQRLHQLRCKQQRLDARRRALQSRQARRADTRRKILVGAVVLAKLDQGVLQKAVLWDWLDAALRRTDDRSLFGLHAIEGERNPRSI